MSELQSILHNLEERGHRLTPPRLAVLAAVLAQKGHFTVEDVMHGCPRIGRATVFRAMRMLTDSGIVCRVLLEDGSLHYRISRHGHHHHVVCVSCGGVRDLDTCAVGGLVQSLAQSTGFEIEGHWLEFYGRCAACREQETVLTGS